MFTNIMVPVDLAHQEKLGRAMQVAADLARHYGAAITYVGVAPYLPSPVAHNPGAYRARLAAFAEEQAEAHGLTTRSHAVLSHDPAADLDPALLATIDEVSADLVVMASHVPGLKEYIWPSNGGTVAAHAKVSVMVVRG